MENIRNTHILRTGFRLVFILNMLFEGDYTKNEIIDKLQKSTGIKISKGTLKLDLNTLIETGCNIIHKNRDENYKISLADKHLPFRIFNGEDYAILDMVKNVSLDFLGYKEIFALKKFYRKISDFFGEEYEKIANFSSYDFINEKILCELETAIKKKVKGIIIYDSPSGKQFEYKVLPVAILKRGGKIYVECNGEKNGILTLRVDNIKSFQKNKDLKFDLLDGKQKRKVRYRVKKKYFKNNLLDNTEKIISEFDDTFLIETNEKDDFFIVQRILTLGENCTCIQNEKIKNDVIQVLKETLGKYQKCS